MLSSAWTRAASRVQGTTGRAHLVGPVVREDDVEDRLGQLGVEARDLLDLAADHVVAERDLAEQAACIRQVDRHRIVVVGLGLADVVKQRPGHRDVAVEAGEERRGGADALGDREGVVEEPVAVGLVVVLRRRGLAEARPARGVRGRRSGRAGAAAGAPGRSRSARAGPPRGGRSRPGGPSTTWSGSYSPGSACRTASIVIWRPNLGLIEKRPVTWTTLPGSAAAKHSATSSQATASTVPVRSESISLRKSSPFLFWRSSRSRTQKTVATCCPSARSRRVWPAPAGAAGVERRLAVCRAVVVRSWDGSR